MRFTTFELVNSNALIVVEFGKNFEIAILGLARARLPQTGSEVFAYLELGLEIIIDPEDGLVSFTAVVTPNSFVLDPGCPPYRRFCFLRLVWQKSTRWGFRDHPGRLPHVLQ